MCAWRNDERTASAAQGVRVGSCRIPSPERFGLAGCGQVRKTIQARTTSGGFRPAPRERQGCQPSTRPQSSGSGAAKIFTATSASLWNSAAQGALCIGMKTRGGGDAVEASAGKMIEQRQTEVRPDSRRKSDPSLDEARLRQQAIGVKLRQMFDQVVNEPVPDEFLDILKRADARKAGQD